MSQYVFTMTSRMVAIACTCALLLGLLLFLLGVQVGKLLGLEQATAPAPASNPPAATAPAAAAQPAHAPATP